MSEPMKIYDGSAEAKTARKQAKSWNGFHLLLTAPARRAVMLSSLKIPMLVVFIVGLAAGIAAGAGVGFGLGFGTALALVIYMGYQNDVYKKLYAPERDQGVLTLPEGMTWEQAVERIRHGFAHPDVEQVTDTPEDITFHSKKRGTYQLKNTPDGLRMTILAKPSRSGKKEYLYAVFGSMLLSQVIALLYPEMISAAQVEEEKAQVNKLFRRHGLPMLIEWVIGIVVLVVMGWMLYMALYSDAARSKGLSEGHYSAFPAEATVGEVLDDFFVNGKWDNYEQSGATFVSYAGECADAQTGGTITIGFYFKQEDDGSFSMDRMTWNGDLNDATGAVPEPESEPEEPAAESVSESVSGSDEESEADSEWDDWDWGEDLYTRIQVDAGLAADGELDNEELSYLRAMGEDAFFDQWEYTMCDDIEMIGSRYDYETAYSIFENYVNLYEVVFPNGSLADKYISYCYESSTPETEDQAENRVHDITGELRYYDD